MCTSNKAEGPWHITHLPKGFYDPGLFFDDDGKAYVVQEYNKISITEVSDSLVAVGPDSLVYTGDMRNGLEGTHVYKINGYYCCLPPNQGRHPYRGQHCSLFPQAKLQPIL